MAGMKISALLTSAGINIGMCIFFLSLYSILRKQPSNVNVYFPRRLASGRRRRKNGFCFERFVPSASWVMRAWETTEEEILAIGGLDAVVFNRMIVFSIRVFSIAAAVCILLVLPVNYHGNDMIHEEIPSELVEVFTIVNVEEGSKWLWAHCLALYIISFSACVLLYIEYKRITRMRLAHITSSPPNPSHFTVLVRSIPWSQEESYSDRLKNFLTKYHGSSYFSHQMVYWSGTIQKMLADGEKMCKKIDRSLKPTLVQCINCGSVTNSFRMLSKDPEGVSGELERDDLQLNNGKQECPAAFAFFKTRYAAVAASEVLQSSNPMLWVIDLAPEPHDVFWSNLWIPYRQLWIRKIATILAAVVLVLLTLVPVTFVQGLMQLEKLRKTFPSLQGIPERDYVIRLVTGYFPSVIFTLFLYVIPPTMMLLSSVEGPISHSGRKSSACCKVIYCYVWTVFFANVLSGSLLSQLETLTTPRSVPTVLARTVPAQTSFFVTYVLSSGWASLSFEAIQVFPLLGNLFKRFVLGVREDHSHCALSFPYHTEVPRVLLFGLLGFTFSIMAPLILPFLLIYFVLAYLVYKNQFLNVYVTKYESGGQLWPIVHNTTVFSLLLTQIIALGVFIIKRSPVALGFTIILVLMTLLFNEYCRQRFDAIFRKNVAEVLIDMDFKDRQSGKLEEIYKQLHSAYCQFASTCHLVCNDEEEEDAEESEDAHSGIELAQGDSWVNRECHPPV